MLQREGKTEPEVLRFDGQVDFEQDAGSKEKDMAFLEKRDST